MKSIRDKKKTAVKFEVQNMNLILHIADGSLVVFRKSDYSFLSNLDKEQLEDFELFGGGDLLGNDELDIHLSVEQLIKTHGTIKLKKAS